jgi:protein-S-isoprenylcysteine O-methyltransferase Ste14
MDRTAALLFGVVAYVVFLGTFLLAIHFVGDLDLIRSGWSIDGDVEAGAKAGGGLQAFLVDAGLLALFAVQHSAMARPRFKEWWTRIVPRPIERSTYVLVASLILLALFALWRPLPETIWDVRGSALGTLLGALFWAGWAIVLVSTFLIDHFELFGLRQVWTHFRGSPPEGPRFRTPGFYRFLRHPIMLGFLVAFWCTPHMTVGHLLFAILVTAYVLIAIQLEERDLAALHGQAYLDYRRSVSMLLPVPRGRAR